jgi:regulator of protease activity HflC (stomatin/prohibitin superfamily)
MQIDILSILFGVGLGLGALSIVFLWLSHFEVEEGHLAALTRFGATVADSTKNQTVNDKDNLDFVEKQPMTVYSPGSHWKWPWDRVIKFSTMERVIDLSGEKGGKYAMAADGTVLRLDSKIRFFPKANDYYSYLFELKNPMGHIREMFTCIIRNEIANFRTVPSANEELLGSYAVIRRERKRLNEQVEFICRNQIGGDYGIQFRGVDLIDIVPPQELESALNGIQNAKTEADTMYARAEGDARQKIVAAEQGVEIAKIRAESVALELQMLGKMVRKLIAEGNVNHYLFHRKTELVGDSKMVFLQKGDAQW